MGKIQFAKPKFLSIDGLDLDYGKFAIRLGEAQYALGLLEGSLKKLHNPLLLVSPLTAKEAAVSSRIEGTQSTVSDVFLHEAGGTTKHSDVRQVNNYRRAMAKALEQTKAGRQLSSHLVEELHGILLDEVRHRGVPGKFRDIEVWIAEKEGDPIEKAIYVPPEPHFVKDYVLDLFKYLEKGEEDMLIKAGIIHYQFEAVHPFVDGNGRMGRLLIPLILNYGKKVSQPVIYMSGYFDENRDRYIAQLHSVDKTGVYEDWLNFFFQSVACQLKDTQEIIENIYKLYDELRSKFGKVKSPYLVQFIEFIFKSPIFTIPMAMEAMPGIVRLTVDRLLKEVLIQGGYVREMSDKRGKAKLYAFTPLLNILK